jgi:AcrR family transcriptional regulator
MTSEAPITSSPRERHKADIRARILIALMELLADGVEINHDRVAARAGVARRTVYRYFPDQSALMQSLWASVTAMAAPAVTLPDTEEMMLASVPDIYRGFDAIAPVATVMRATPQGRQVHLAQKEHRRERYGAALADAVKDLPEEDRVLATAMLQMLHTTPWLEMRDSWDLDGEQIGTACGWAMRVLLKDLRARKGQPLGDGPACGACP